MKARKIAVLLTAVLFVLVTIGCAPRVITPKIKVQKESFGAKKKFAVVSIASTKEFFGERGFTQTFKKADDIPGMNTQPIIDKLKPTVIKELDSCKNFKLMPEKSVLQSKGYKSLTEDDRIQRVAIFKVEMNTAKGYKYISDATKMGQLAKDLKVDAVVAVIMNFSVRSYSSGVNLGGFALGKKEYRPVVTTTAVAYDKDGTIIWKDTVIRETEPGDKKAIIGLDVRNTDFLKLHPVVIDMGEKTMGVLLSRLNDTMAGKDISRVQNMRDESLYDKKETKKK